MRNENYITIQGWMRNELDLKGNELMTYALIYGFCQEEGTEFTGSIGYIADWLGASKRTVHRVLSELVERGLLKKRDEVINGITFPRYATNVAPHDKMSEGSDKMSEGSDKMSPNNIVNTIDDINNISSSLHSEDIYGDPPKKASKRFKKPTVEEIQAYIDERGSSVDAEKFFDYYESNGWMVGKSHMKDWKAAVRNWERNNNGTKGQTNFGRGNQKRKDVAERFTRSYDDFPGFPEAGQTRPD